MPDQRDWTPPPKPAASSVWRCPCGFTGNWGATCGHRKGWRSRPECKGTIYKLRDDDGNPVPYAAPVAAPGAGDYTESALETILEEAAGGMREYIPSLDGIGDDPEAIAQRMNEMRRGALAELAAPESPAPEDWLLERQPGPPIVSSNKENVAVPVVLRLWYDWFRQNGWHQGDGGFGAFITDLVLDHIANCCGLAVVIVNRQEVGLDAAARA